VPIQTVFGYVQTAPIKPFYLGFGKIPFQYRMPRPAPNKLLGQLVPKMLGVVNAFLVSGMVFLKGIYSVYHKLSEFQVF
jgi:hypothetical protein